MKKLIESQNEPILRLLDNNDTCTSVWWENNLYFFLILQKQMRLAFNFFIPNCDGDFVPVLYNKPENLSKDTTLAKYIHLKSHRSPVVIMRCHDGDGVPFQ